MPPVKFCKIAPKNTHFYAFLKQVSDNTVFTFFLFFGSEGMAMAQQPLPFRTLVSNPSLMLRRLYQKSIICIGQEHMF